ncbi:MAG TPA: GNAT family N-acetyltransferase [Azospirillum sp.]|nr:GNAT family N-acetyltransferase [Azospirillum sp.]
MAQPMRKPAEEPVFDETPSVTVVRSADDLAAHVDALEDLARDLAVQNPSYEPWLAIPLARLCERKQRFVFLLMHQGDGPSRRLLAFFPFERGVFHQLAPLPSLRLWKDPYNYVGHRCDPLVRTGAADLCVARLFDWLKTDPASPGLIDLRRLTGGTEITRAVERHLAADDTPHPTLYHVHTSEESHLYRRQADADAYMNTVFSTSERQTLRRKARRLQDLGPVVYRDLDEADDAGAVIDAFLELESKGWKGQEGVAVETHAGHRPVVKAILEEAHRRGRLSLLTMHVAGQLVAARCVFLAAPGSYLFKLTYDEDERYAKRSPGLLLELEGIRRLHRDDTPQGAGIAWMDTWGSARSKLFNRTRSEGFLIHRYAVADRRAAVVWLLPLFPRARAVARGLEARWRTARERTSAWLAAARRITAAAK